MYLESQFLGLVLYPTITSTDLSNLHDDNVGFQDVFVCVCMSSTQDQIIISIFETIIRQIVKSTQTL
jgi:hypothetical protein